MNMVERENIKKQSIVYLVIKRLLDIVLSILALIVFSPIFLIVWIADRFGDNRGPLFYKQVRVGKNHRKFKILKFRSMVVNADEILHNDHALYQKYKDHGYKLEPSEDPRITHLGEILRKTSIDEIPQFINILRGDMSIIGPRPVVEEELVEYGDQVDKFLSVKPGAMGLWQASGRSNIIYPQRAKLELSYVDRASLWFDFEIMIKNIISIFKSTGAY